MIGYRWAGNEDRPCGEVPSKAEFTSMAAAAEAAAAAIDWPSGATRVTIRRLDVDRWDVMAYDNGYGVWLSAT